MYVEVALTGACANIGTQALRPWIADRPELSWEHHIAETPRDLWRVNGLDAPPSNSEAEAMWTRENKPLPWEKL